MMYFYTLKFDKVVHMLKLQILIMYGLWIRYLLFQTNVAFRNFTFWNVAY